MAILQDLYKKYGRPVAKALGYVNDRTPEQKRALQQKALNQASNLLRPASNVATRALNAPQRSIDSYFKPTTQVRTRDVVRELTGVGQRGRGAIDEVAPPVLRAAPRAARALDLSFGEAVGKPVSEITPTTKLDRFFLGDRPVISAQSAGRLGVAPYLERKGVPTGLASKLGTPIALAGVALDINPIAGGGRKAIAKEASILAKLTDIGKVTSRLNKLGLADDVTTRIAPIIAKTTDARLINKGLSTELATAKQLNRVRKPSELPGGQAKLAPEQAGKTFQTINEGGVMKSVTGKPVKIVDGVDTFIHQGDNPKRTIKGFVVSEKSTGRYLASGETEREAISNAKSIINKVGKRKLKQTIAENRLQPTPTGSKGFVVSEKSTAKLRVQAPKQPARLEVSSATKTPLQKAEQTRISGQRKSPTQAPSTTGSGRTGDTSLASIIEKNPTLVKEKVHILNYLNTPDRVLNKIGLGNEAKLLEQQYSKYIKELPQEIDKVGKWASQTNQKENINIFKALDGQAVTLSPKESVIAGEIKAYLANWADRLGLPQDKRISSYITHIFEKDFIKKEFPDEIANLISDKVAGSVYDPFVQQRLGKSGYIEDTWRALDAYVKRATRKVNMDPALERVKTASRGLEQSQFNYVKRYADRINLRPTEFDNMLDNFIKSTPIGYKAGARPTASIARTSRQIVFRGTIGLNVSTTLKNLSQGANTYAKLGEKYTVAGYFDIIKNWKSKELQEVGVLADNLIQDRQLSSTKKLLSSFDKGLFYLFETAEKINRGAAYYGAKAKALAEGKSLEEAVALGKRLVKDTQFTFGSVDTPLLLQSDTMKVFTQFMSFTIKQGEFLGEMITKKEWAGLIRWLGASLAFVGTVGKMFGMEPKDLIPQFRFGAPPVLAPAYEAGKAIAGMPDEYDQPRTTSEKLSDVSKTLVPFIPGGTQIKKTVQGLGAYRQGASTTTSGRVRYPIEQTPLNLAKTAVFGQYSTPEARNYFKNDGQPLSEKQSEFFKQAPQGERESIYSKLMSSREQAKLDKSTKEKLSTGGTITEGNKISYMTNEGDIKEIDLAIFDKDTKGTSFEALENKDNQLKALRDIYKSDLPDDQKKQLIGKHGQEYEYEDIEYDSYANASANMRAEYFTRLADTMDHEAFLEELAQGRKKSISGKQLVTGSTTGTLGKLRDAGLISSSEYTRLNKIKDLKEGKAIGTVGKGGSGGGRGISGMTKSQKAKTTTLAARYATQKDAFKRANDTEGYIKMTQQYINDLQDNLASVPEGSADYWRLTNKINDAIADAQKVSDKGFGTQKSIPRSAVSAPKLGKVKAPSMPTFSRTTSRTTVKRPTVRKPRVSGQQLANMR